MTWEKDGTHWPDDVRDGDEVEQGEQQPPAPTREEWTDVGIHHVRYHDAERRLHRADGPAVTETWPDGYRREEWRWRDKRHRKDGPAITSTLPDGARCEEWWEDGKFIREERTPAPDRGDGLRTTLIDETRTIRESIDHLRKAGYHYEHCVGQHGFYHAERHDKNIFFSDGGVLSLLDDDDKLMIAARCLVRHFGDRPDVLARLLGR